MDVQALHSCFASTLDADVNKRHEAEIQLKQAEQAPGFINGCLDIVLEPQVNGAIKVAAAIYLKNKVIRYWKPYDPNIQYKLDPEEKQTFRSRLIPAISKAPTHVRPTLVHALGAIVGKDFPDDWPDLVDITLKLFQSDSVEDVSTGASCLLEISRHYRYTTNETRKNLDKVIDTAFPGVLNIANSLVNETSQQAGSLLRDIIKTYKMATYHVLPVALQQPENLVGWGNLFLNVIKKDLPEDVLSGTDDDEREIHPWVKCKKWSLANFYRLFSRYANHFTIKKGEDSSYREFAQYFTDNMAPEILKVYFEQIQLWVDNKIWLGNACLFQILSFFEQCITVKSTWEIIKPHVNTLISHVIFPLLCPTDNDLELFEDEPQEYINKHIDMLDDTMSPDIAATNLLLILVKRKRKVVFNPLLQFVQSVVNKHLESPQDLAVSREKEGALRMMGAIAYMVLNKNSPIVNMMEDFLVQYVFPDFSSNFGFLRARACEFLNAYAETKFKNVENISYAYQMVLKCMNDEHLPVQVEAALALQPLIGHEDVRIALSSRIPEVMQHLLDLGNKVDIDAISGIMEEFVEVFSHQLTPFAVQLAQQLTDQFMRIASEMVEKQNISPEELSNLDNINPDEKVMAGLGILSTLTSLLLALDNASEIVTKLESVLMPIFVTVLEQDLSEFYTEVFGLIENCTFGLKKITPDMWGVFRLMYKSYQGAGVDFLDEMLPCFENFIQYGAYDMSNSPELQNGMFTVIKDIMTDEDNLGATDRTIACSLIQLMLLSLKEGNSIDQYVPEFLNMVMTRIKTDSSKLKNIAYCVSLLEVVIASFNYNSQATLQYLESNQFTGEFFTLWFNKMNHFTRVYDKKLSAMAILSIISLPADNIPASIQSNLPQLTAGLLTIMSSIPEALAKKAAIAKEFESYDHNFGDDDGDYYDDDENDWDDDDDEQEGGALPGISSKEINNNSSAEEYLDFLEQETSKYGYFDDDDEELEEEPLVENILDSVNVDKLFRDIFMNLSSNDSSRYQLITSELGDNDQSVIQEIITRSDEQQKS